MQLVALFENEAVSSVRGPYKLGSKNHFQYFCQSFLSVGYRTKVGHNTKREEEGSVKKYAAGIPLTLSG